MNWLNVIQTSDNLKYYYAFMNKLKRIVSVDS